MSALAETATAPKILLVDDQPGNLLALESILGGQGYVLVQASCGEDGLRCLLKEEFALVVLDVLMPGLDGFETAALIRDRERSRYTPIIFVTGISTDETHVARGYHLGAVDYIFKPIVPEVLRAKVQVFVDLFQKTEQTKAQATELTLALDLHIRTENDLRQSEEKYRQLFGAVSDAILVFHRGNRRLVDSNTAARRLYGYSATEFRQLSARDVFGRDADLIFDLGPRAPKRVVLEAQKAKGGGLFPAEITRSALRVGERDLLVALVRDVSERRRSEAAEKLIAREAMQREFVATVSHELRTPIAAIKGFAETLRRGAIDDVRNRRKFVGIIESHADKLGDLVEDLLTLNSLESGRRKPAPEAIPAGPFLGRIAEGMEPLARRSQVRVETSAAGGAAIWADRSQLTQILENLLDNAIKYNRKGGRVRLSASRLCGRVLLEVADTGIGMSPEELPLIFEPFHRSETAKALTIRGTGLGLYIIKALIESNGGSIRARSARGEGSTFMLELPAAGLSPGEVIAEGQGEKDGEPERARPREDGVDRAALAKAHEIAQDQGRLQGRYEQGRKQRPAPQVEPGEPDRRAKKRQQRGIDREIDAQAAPGPAHEDPLPAR